MNNLRSLPNDVRLKLRAGMKIDSFTRCVQELIYNSLDAKSTSIAVRINLTSNDLQVIDNGNGINFLNLNLLGLPHMTSKCDNLNDLKRTTNYYGYRGESLSNIAEISETLRLVTRNSDLNDETRQVDVKTHEVTRVKTRPSRGTTVTVRNLFHNLPVRKRRIDYYDLNEIKRQLSLLSILHYDVSMTLRNDVNKELVFNVAKSSSIADRLATIYPERDYDFVALKYATKHLKIAGLLSKRTATKLQLFYVNGRNVCSSIIDDLVKSILKRSSIVKSDDYVYLVNVKCPYVDVNFIYSIKRTKVDFNDWQRIETALNDCLIDALKKNDLWPTDGAATDRLITQPESFNKPNATLAISDVSGILRSNWIRRRKRTIEQGQTKSSDTKRTLTKKKKRHVLGLKREKDASLGNVNDDVIDGRQIKSFFDDLKTNAHDFACGIDTKRTDVTYDTINGKQIIMEKFFKTNEDEKKRRKTKGTVAMSIVTTTTSVRYRHEYAVTEATPTSTNYGGGVLRVDAPEKRRKTTIGYDFTDKIMKKPNVSEQSRTRFVEKAVQTEPIDVKRIEAKNESFATFVSHRYASDNLPICDFTIDFDAYNRTFELSDDGNSAIFHSPQLFLQFSREKSSAVREVNERRRILVDESANVSNKTSSVDVVIGETPKSCIEYDDRYIHKKTGMTFFNKGKSPESDFYALKKRLDFVPKGMSPILDLRSNDLNVSLTPSSKRLLREALIENANELETIKWSSNNDLDAIYEAKCETYENDVPTVGVTSNVKVDRSTIERMRLIGQWDRKFIVGVCDNRLFLFDQHAVHERIRLEAIVKGAKDESKFQSVECNEPIVFRSSNLEDYRLLTACKKSFRRLGIDYVIDDDKIIVKSVTKCLHDKYVKQNDTSILTRLVRTLINEEIDVLRTTRGVPSTTPTIITNALNMEACRGAIKFGDALKTNDCLQLLKGLSKCSLPFQCAHGRPTMVPLMALKNESGAEKKPNLISLKNTGKT